MLRKPGCRSSFAPGFCRIAATSIQYSELQKFASVIPACFLLYRLRDVRIRTRKTEVNFIFLRATCYSRT